MINPPPFADHWPELAAVANDMLARRSAGYPPRVEAGKMDAAEAARGIRIGTAIAQLWHAVIRHTDLPELQASAAEMESDLATAAARAAGKIIEGSPDYPACVAALHWHAAPWMPGSPTPRIAALHLINQAARQQAAAAQQESIAA